MKIKNLKGMKVGHLTVISRASRNRQGSITWLCKCECGNQKVYSSDHLTRKKYPVQSCGCKAIKLGSEHSQWKGVGDISGNWWNTHILRERRTKRTKLPIKITIKDAWNLYLKQDKKCALSGLPIIIRNGSYGDASIDRIDSGRGYELDNIQWVHKDINFMKRTYSQKYFIELCKKVSNNFK